MRGNNLNDGPNTKYERGECDRPSTAVFSGEWPDEETGEEGCVIISRSGQKSEFEHTHHQPVKDYWNWN